MSSLTIKDIPAKLHRALKARAARNRRSLQAEIIVTLEESLPAHEINVRETLARFERLRERIGITITDEEITRPKRAGRS